MKVPPPKAPKSPVDPYRLPSKPWVRGLRGSSPVVEPKSASLLNVCAGEAIATAATRRVKMTDERTRTKLKVFTAGILRGGLGMPFSTATGRQSRCKKLRLVTGKGSFYFG